MSSKREKSYLLVQIIHDGLFGNKPKNQKDVISDSNLKKIVLIRKIACLSRFPYFCRRILHISLVICHAGLGHAINAQIKKINILNKVCQNKC